LSALGQPQSDRLQAALKLKRLKQVLSKGGRYQDYLSEQRSEDDDKQAVVEYAKEQDEIATELQRTKIAFLPDCGPRDSARWFYQTLYSPKLASFNITDLEMPNVFDFTTKRYEVQWLTHMRSFQPALASFDLVIAHGTSAEAVLRYLESGPLPAVVLIDASDLYTAGERHGRSWHWSAITKNCPLIACIASTPDGLSALSTFSEHLPAAAPHDKTRILQRVSAEMLNMITKK